MAYVNFYDALGTGANMPDTDGQFVPVDGSLTMDGDPDVSQYDYDTLMLSFSFNGGALYAMAFVSEAGYPYYVIESIYYYDSAWNSLVDLDGINIEFNINDDFSSGVYFTNLLAGNDIVEGNNYSDILKSGDGDDSLSGWDGNDVLYGENGNDTLYGDNGNDTLNGGAGADLMYGGDDNDRYIVDHIGDVVAEGYDDAWSGIDTVQSSVTFTLAGMIEHLTLAGSATINGTGNAKANIIAGNSGTNILSGLGGNDNLSGGGGDDSLNGGAGADTLRGNLGNDTYIVDNVGDIVTELSAQGIDLVKSGITYTLTANVEKLTLTGTNAINGTGNGMNNVLQGNSVANKLVGLAGADTLNGGGGNDILVGGGGKDVLTGGLGNDVFVFNSAPNAGTNLDTIKDYSAAADTIRLENAVFTQLSATGALSAGNFKVGTAAADANDYIIYTQSTGALYYDADANGAGAAVQIATVYASGTTPASLNAAEFVVI